LQSPIVTGDEVHSRPARRRVIVTGVTPLSVGSDGRLLGTNAATTLERAVRPLVAAHAAAGESGIVPLREGRDAFAARYLLAQAAERTLDIQYYIWHDDMAGRLLFDVIRRAAERGVRVRLLLDDNNTKGLDAVLASLEALPGIEIRLFNPFTHRHWRSVDYLTDFSRLNRRMHNKSFTADGQATIVGGRNVGDEYFDAGHG
jgi:putative cardiolipin synthase